MPFHASRVFLGLCTAFVIGSTAAVPLAAAEQPKDVNVANTATNPVPVAIQGSSSISGNVDVTVTNQVTIRDADRPTGQSITIQFFTNSTSGSGAQFWEKFSVYTVP